jgi:redox-sensitive bicupin YhaK (pirin superfamily)
VGDGFPVRTLFAYSNLGSVVDPFLLLDHAGPHEFPPTKERLGVGEHPHRGFETVTIVYSGEVEHRDSSGGGGKIGPGDVQWMTAAGGIVHEEFHGRDYAKRGGPFEMVQLWVNLPARDKMAPPRYQGIRDAEIPALELPGATVRIIAGAFENKQGPAQTFSPIEVWDLRLSNAPLELPLPDGHTTALVVLHGSVRPEGCETVREGEVALFDRAGSSIRLEEVENATALLLSGKPLGEPIVGHGPFVMNAEDEIRQAIKDYQSGRMGHLR